MDIEYKNRVANYVTWIYGLIGFVEVIAEFQKCKPLIYVFKPLIPLLLMFLYFKTTKTNNILFYLALLFSLITNILFIPDDKNFLFFGIVAFTFHRILIIVYTYKLLKIKDFIPIFFASIPFLLIFFYVLSISESISGAECFLLMFHNILISAFAGITLSNYVMKDGYNASWLLICGMFFVMLQFIVFIEKFYLDLIIFRPIAMALNALAFYSFYRFVIATEKVIQ